MKWLLPESHIGQAICPKEDTLLQLNWLACIIPQAAAEPHKKAKCMKNDIHLQRNCIARIPPQPNRMCPKQSEHYFKKANTKFEWIFFRLVRISCPDKQIWGSV